MAVAPFKQSYRAGSPKSGHGNAAVDAELVQSCCSMWHNTLVVLAAASRICTCIIRWQSNALCTAACHASRCCRPHHPSSCWSALDVLPGKPPESDYAYGHIRGVTAATGCCSRHQLWLCYNHSQWRWLCFRCHGKKLQVGCSLLLLLLSSARGAAGPPGASLKMLLRLCPGVETPGLNRVSSSVTTLEHGAVMLRPFLLDCMVLKYVCLLLPGARCSVSCLWPPQRSTARSLRSSRISETN